MTFVSGWRRTLALLAALFAALMCAGAALTLDPVRASASEGRFDANAARERLARILGDETPHPIDSAAQDAVRERLLQEIKGLGFSPELHESFACRPQPRGPLVDCGHVRNVVFSIGPPDAPAILAASHYDSVPASPGASDDGLGVSIWLELARMLAQAPLQRRVIFLFTDGEEQALLGAYAFAQSDPLMDEVESLVDLEARGSRGPAVFFESNLPNADAVAAYSAAPRPAANSVMADVYRFLPNSTDVSVLARPGLDVVNIAVLDGLEDYHTNNDSIASQDLRSVQHMGDSALEVMRRLAGGPDADLASTYAYTDIASRVFVYAPVWLVLAALAASGLVSFIAFWRAGAEGRWRTLAAPPLALILSGALAFAADFVLGLVRPGEDYAFAYPEPARAWCVLFAFLGLVLSAMALTPARSQAAAAGVFWFALLGGLASIAASGISILFAPPALAYAVAWLVSLAWKPAETIGRWLTALLVLIVWAPTLYLVELALGFGMPFVFAILVALMLLPWLGAIAQAQGESRWRAAAATLGVAALAAVVASALVPAATEARPQALNLSYFLNASDGEARIVAGAATRALPRNLRGAFERELLLPGDTLETWTAPAAIEQIPAPVLQNIVVTEEGGERHIRGELAMNGAYRATIRIPLAAEPLRVAVNGVQSDFADTGGERREFMNVACQGRACDGAQIELVLGSDGATDTDWFVIGQTPGLPVAAAAEMRARRPAHSVPIQFGDTAISLTRFRPGG